jgi:hypothetical protein
LRIYPLPGGTEGNHKNVHQDNQSLVWNWIVVYLPNS